MISVLGQGVAALCAATALMEQGHAVEIIVPEDAPIAASALAGGMLAPFCEGATAPPVVVARGQRSVDWWAARVPVVRRGTLVVAAARDVGELEPFARATQGHVWAEPGALEPELEGRFGRGLFYAAEAHLDPVEALAHLRQGLLAGGVRFHAGPARGQWIVDGRGYAARDRLADLRAVRGERIEVWAPDVTLGRPIRLLHPRFACYVVPRRDHRFMIGATMVESADSGPITARAVMELLSAAYTLHPGFAEARVLSSGAGLRPAFADNLPRLQRDGQRVHLNGLYRHGFLLAPALAGDLVAALQGALGHVD